MKLYNTLTKKIEEVQPQSPPEVKVYTCGPTVYDYAHIGHMFNYVRMDTLIRVLKLNGYMPKWIMNITDVGHLVSDGDEGEDKLEKGAKREGKTAWEIAEYYTQDFLENIEQLNITTPTMIVKATDHITEQIDLIKILEEKGFTYIIDDGVYFDTLKFPSYADFAKLDLDNIQEGARIGVNTQKRQASDFALWKFSPKDTKRDMEWDSPWGKGFPGWHVECSAMSMKYLGNTLDIHTGGIDHIPVHHTNEIAQSEAATGKQFSKHWMHSNHLMVDGQKISKSLGNSIRVKDILDKGISPLAIRLLALESHYSTQSNFSYANLNAAASRLTSIQAFADLRFQIADSKQSYNWPDLQTDLIDFKNSFSDTVSSDLQTPNALSLLSSLQNKLTNKLIHAQLANFIDCIETLDTVLGLDLMKSSDINQNQKDLISMREQARNDKDFQKSDQLRDNLLSQNIEIRDTPSGSIWARI